MPFKSEKQARYFFYKAKKSPKWKKMAQEWASKTNFNNLPEVVKSIKKKIRRRRNG